ncbi:asparagine synthase (glutamine-hydrolyzing) [Pyrococcus sp. ST04]|uniref:asparagine synthase (glutamine-hydrolyzing) n=1 Tax=Pyrococcus sp. ST04 TaxID=1183377 RepID=UPI0002605EB4|nr:asparagine synthase (glutamine-hydrolyzing) [Pyrococcus sp. ST04]AFK22608.1 asparagine synthetase [Pyrococcus sp. ST04]
MCLIAGGLSLSSKDIAKIIETGKHRGPDSFGVWSDGFVLKSSNFGDVDEVKGGEHVLIQCRLAITGSKSYTQPFYNDIVLVHNGEIYNHEFLREYLVERGVSFETDVDSEVILRLLEYYLYEKRLSPWEAVKKIMLMLNGDYAVAFLYNGKLYLFRDPIGIRPIYYSQSGRFASEKKVLWAIGDDAHPVNPGELVEISRSGIVKRRLLRLTSIKSLGSSYKDGLKNLLENSVNLRKRGKIGVLFSGGLDSSLIALIASRFSKVVLYSAGAEGSRDIEWARKVSEELGLELREFIFTLDDVKTAIPEVMFAIEEPNPMNLAIGIPLYFATKLAREDGMRVLLSGQGADELFGGYAKYLNNPTLMIKDFEELAERNLARDDKVSMLNGVEVRYPYLDQAFAVLALNAPINEKIKDGKRKVILRKIAIEMGLPEFVANREKKAMQYGSNSQKFLEKIAKSEGVKLRELAALKFREVFGRMRRGTGAER